MKKTPPPFNSWLVSLALLLGQGLGCKHAANSQMPDLSRLAKETDWSQAIVLEGRHQDYLYLKEAVVKSPFWQLYFAYRKHRGDSMPFARFRMRGFGGEVGGPYVGDGSYVPVRYEMVIRAIDPVSLKKIVSATGRGGSGSMIYVRALEHPQQAATTVAIAGAISDGVESAGLKVAAEIPVMASAETLDLAKAAFRSRDDDLQKVGAGILVKIGKPAVPYLQEILKSNDHFSPETWLAAARILSRMPDVDASETVQIALATLPNRRFQKVVLEGLGEFGGRAAAALPELEKIARHVEPSDPNRGTVSPWQALRAIETLGKIGKPALPTLLDIATNPPHPELRPAAVHAVGYIGPDAESAVPVLVEYLNDPADPANKLKKAAAFALAHLGDAGGNALRAAVKPENSQAFLEVMKGVAEAGPSAAALLPLLESLLLSDAWHNQEAASQVLAKMGEAGLPLLLKGLDTTANPTTRKYAAQGLGALGPKAESAVPQLIKLTGDPDFDIRVEAYRALAKIGIAANAALPNFLTALNETDFRLYEAGLGGIAALEPGAEAAPAVPRIIQILSEKGSGETAQLAISALAAIGPKAAPAVNQLITVVKSGNYRAVALAAGALGKIGLDTPEVREALTVPLRKQSDRRSVEGALEGLALLDDRKSLEPEHSAVDEPTSSRAARGSERNLRVVHNAKSPLVSFEVNGRKFSRTLRGRTGRSAMAGIQVDLREGALVKVTHPEGWTGDVLPVTQLKDAS